MKVEVKPTKTVRILGLDKRSIENMLWCAFSYGVDRVFWVDEYLCCLEVYDKAMKYEIDKGIFPISQLCYARFPNYSKTLEIEMGYKMLVVNMSDMKFYKKIVKAIKENEEKRKPRKETDLA